MKSFYLALVFSLSFFSCTEYVEGPMGPAGRDGLDGLNGKDGEEAYTFDYEVDFLSPEYYVLIDLPLNFNMQISDVVMVYILWEVQDGAEIWRALPQNIFTDNGLFQYNFDYTTENVAVFLDAEFPIGSMPADYLLNQALRIVVIPGQFLENARLDLDLSDYNAVAKRFNLKKISTDQ